jgi:hypothetical protein
MIRISQALSLIAAVALRQPLHPVSRATLPYYRIGFCASNRSLIKMCTFACGKNTGHAATDNEYVGFDMVDFPFFGFSYTFRLVCILPGGAPGLQV